MIPESAIQAATEAIGRFMPGYTVDNLARAALDAATPFLRAEWEAERR